MSKTSKNKPIVIIIVAGILIVTGLLSYFALSQNNKPAPADTTNTVPIALDQVIKPRTAQASAFAAYEDVPVTATPSIALYQVAADLKNITNPQDFTLSTDAQQKLIANNFVVVPAEYQEFFMLYENNRYAQTPSFITTDSLLHNYHLFFDDLLKKTEQNKLIPELKALNAGMLATAASQYDALKDTDWAVAAKRDLAFFAVGSKLLDPTVTVPVVVQNEVTAELALIEAHAGITDSVVMNIGLAPDATTPSAYQEDYSQYIPRGHYDKNPDLQRYFKSMMWYGRITFIFNSDDSIKSAILITGAMNQGVNYETWQKIYEPINFFVGKTDDLNYFQINRLMKDVYGPELTLSALISDTAKLTMIKSAAKKLNPPQINSIPIFNAAIEPDRETAIKGFRFFGQRFTIDAAIFQRLLTREIGPADAACAAAPFSGGRMLPKGLDIPAAMGSTAAADILRDQGDFKLACYPENMSRLQSYLAELKIGAWTQNLYWTWMYSLLPLTTEKGAGYPSFMQNLAWQHKNLNTYLGSWTELKHDTILYAKQVYAELGAGGSEEPPDYRGYVEPNPEVYARLASLAKMTRDGLQGRELLAEADAQNLTLLYDLSLKLKTISEKELGNQALTTEEDDLIKSYGGQLEHFWLEAFRDEGIQSRSQLSDEPAALVADVATDPNGQVLEEGIGNIYEIYAAVPIDGKLRLAKGGVFSYYEFPWLLSDRLTDTKWREMIASDLPPDQPDWTAIFMAPAAEQKP